jgi:Tol biopolymer transport system component
MGERTRRVVSGEAGLAFFAACVMLSGLGCNGDDITEPGKGTLEVTTSTDGVERDQDGYTLQMDAAQAQTIGSAGTLQITDLAPGNHVVQLGGAAANCTVAGENPRPVSIPSGQTTVVAFVVTCRSTIGSLQVSSTTVGTSPDANGYLISVDGRDQGTLGQNDAILLSSIAPGDHLVGLGEVTGNCLVEGDNPRDLTFTAGQSFTAAFEVTCAAPPANPSTVRLSTTTIGSDPDPDGYVFTVDDGASQPLGVNATTMLDNLAAGSHSLRLSGIAENCGVQGPNPSTVIASSDAVADVRFEVVCQAHTGSIRVSVTSSGDTPDPDGYIIQLDGGPQEQRIPVNGTLSFDGVAAGTHTVELLDASSHCSMAEPPARSVSVAAGGSSEVGFLLTCVASTGGIQLITKTNGRSLDQHGYAVSLDGGAPISMRPNDVYWFGGLAPGAHQIALSELPTDCRTDGENPANITVIAGYPTQITVTVTCSLSGGRIAFLSTRDGNLEIYVMNPDGSEQTRLTNDPDYDHSPAWSPDASEIAFVSHRDGNDEIYVMNADGSGGTNLTNTTFTDDDPVSNAGPSWSPDGSKIAFTSARGGKPGGIWVMNSDGADPTQLTSGDERAPAWSPDGKKIAAKRVRVADRGDGTSGGTTDIVVMNADGTDPAQIFTTIIDCALHIEWSPDGTRIAFNGCDYTWSIQVINPDGTGLTQLVPRNSNNEHPTWSPDGRRIAFSSDRGGLVTLSDIYVMNTDGTGLTQLTDNPAYDFDPVWSR